MAATRFDVYEDELQKLRGVLSSRPQSAKRLAAKLGCSKPTVYARIRTLQERGVAISTVEFREGITGPKTTGYLLT